MIIIIIIIVIDGGKERKYDKGEPYQGNHPPLNLGQTFSHVAMEESRLAWDWGMNPF